MHVPGAVAFLAGWGCGWLLFARRDSPPGFATADPGRTRAAVAVVIPARDEQARLPALLASVAPQLAAGDELVVVDDHSADATVAVGARGGARVVAAADLPPGWTGKAWACSSGAAATVAPTLVFLDADVVLAPGALDRIAAEVERHGGLVSVQPWHRTARAYEQLSLLFNLLAVMGSGQWAPWGNPRAARLAYGPVLAVARTEYERVGGHSHGDVRGSVVDDIALARRFERRVTVALGRGLAEFRMYPSGARALIEGWTKNIGSGAGAAPSWAFVLAVGWLWSVIGAPGAGWPWWILSAGQLWWFARRVGRWCPLAIVAGPALAVVFLAVLARSSGRRIARRDVTWRGRNVPLGR